MRNSVFTIAIVLSALSNACGQPRVKDSLENVLRGGVKNSSKVDVLNQLAYQYYDFNDSIAAGYASSALELATRIGYAKGLKHANTMMGLGFLSKSEFKEAIRYFLASEKIKADGSNSDATYNLTLLGNCYRDMAKYDSALIILGNARSSYRGQPNAELSSIFKNIAIIYLLQWKNSEAIAMADSATMYLNKNYKDSDQFVQMDIWSIYGQAYKNTLQFELSKKYYDKMCDASMNLDDYYHQITCQLNRGELEFERSNYMTSLSHYFKALELAKKYVYPPQYVKILIKIGETYLELSQYDMASEYLHKVLRISERYGLPAETALIYANLAWIDKDLLHLDRALSYANKSLEIRKSIGDKKGIANCYNLFSLIYLLKKDFQKSIDEQERSLAIRQEIQFVEGISASIFNLSLVYEELNQLDKAIDYQKRAIVVEEKTTNKQSLAISYNSLARLLVKTGKLNEAFDYLTKAKLLSEYTQSFLLKRNNAREFADYYEAKGDFKKAFEYQVVFQQWNDSVYSEKSAMKLAEAEAMYNVEMKEKDIALLKQTKEAQENQLLLQQSELSRKNWIITFATVVIIIALIAGFFLFQLNRYKTKANLALKDQQEEIQAQSEELQEANQQIATINKGLEEKVESRTIELRQAYKELDTFFYRASHDFRRPITTFLGLSGVAKITLKDPIALELFDKVSETATSLDKMLQKLQSISDVGANQMVFKEVFLADQIHEVVDNFSATLSQKKILCTMDIQGTTPFVSYPAMVKIIIENLVENAIYFSRVENGFVTIRTSVNVERGIIEIADNGEGIHDEYKSRIFEMYFRANEKSKGNGLGLYIAKKAVEKLNGRISFSSQYGVGTTFIAEIPNIS